jgi:hypothetical protein
MSAASAAGLASGRTPLVRPALGRAAGTVVVAVQRWPLGLILILQAAIALITLHNTVFQDEGLYLYAGRQIFWSWTGGPKPLENYAFYFSGYPYIYPVIGGVLDEIGGLELARDFSLICMLGVTSIVYVSTRSFFNRQAALFAAALYASLGTVLFLSRLATYDALCLLLLAASALLAIHIPKARRPWAALAIGPFLVVAVLTKYAAMLFIPSTIALIVVGNLGSIRLARILRRFGLALLGLSVSAVGAVRTMDRSAFHAIVGSTTDRVPIVEKPRIDLAVHVLYMGGVVYAAALLGLILVWRHHPRLRLTALLMFGSSWLAPLYHIYAKEAVSLDKHMAFSLFFAMPLAGYALVWASGMVAREMAMVRRSVSGSAFQTGTPTSRFTALGMAWVLVAFTLGLQQSQALYTGWPSSAQLTYVLHTQMRDGSGRYLVEDIEVVRYDCAQITQPWQWNGVNYFYYLPSPGHPLFGDPALATAIKNQYFALVELSFIYQPAEANFIAAQMAATRNYDLIATVPFTDSYGSAYYYLWRSAMVPGHGNYASVSQSPP